jgi:hypothetical protein
MITRGEDKGGGIPQGQVIAEALDRNGKTYRKNGYVRARRVSVATPVLTILADGRRETRNVAAPGDYIVTGPGGEQYVVKPDVFAARYERKSGSTDLYFAHGRIVAVPNPLGNAVYLVASWGEVQSGSGDCMIADTLDPATKKRAGRPYIIDRAEFEKTYSRVKLAWYWR